MDGMKDPRCAYIAQTASALFGAPALAGQIAQAPEVHKFLNEINTKVLQIMSDGQAFRCFVNSVANPPTGTLECHYIKIGKDEIRQDNIHQQILVSSIRGSSVQSLFSYISTIYTPILFNDVEEGSKQNTQLRDLLYSLKAGLQRTLRKRGQSLQQSDYNEEDVKGILQPTDEIELWQENERENYGSQQNENLRRKAELINQHFGKVSKQFYELEQMDLGSISAFVNQVQDTLDQIWQDPKISPPYSQTRMEHFFVVMSKQLGSRIELEFQKTDVWQSSFSDVRVKLNECMRIFKSWKDRVTELTREFWKGQGVQRQWKGKTYTDGYLDNMISRINEIFELRSQHDELLRLLSPEEQKRLNVDSTFNPFRKVNSFYTNEYQAQSWSKAKNEYEKILEPMEKEICSKLRKEIFSEKLTPSQLLREFQRWKGLLSKDSIKRELQNERESLLVQLAQDVRKTKEDFEARTGQSLEQIPGMEKPPQTNNVSDVVSAIVWSRQLSQKIQSNQKVAQSLFGDLPSIQKFDLECKDLCAQIKDFEDNLFSKWHTTIQKALTNPNEKQKYQMSGQLMEFDYEAGGLLKVNYSDKLVTLVKDARMLGELGFKIHKDILAVTENAKKFYKEGVTLKQVANFYNSMGTQIIECQKPMMLDKAQNFEYIIKNPKGKKGDDGKSVTWNDPIEIENYIKQVQSKATELISENRRLRKVHISIVDMIVELMNIDLLKNKNLWKENITKIRKIIDQTTSSRSSPELCKLWLTHLNYQLYKALEHQYQMGLESLNESLPEIQCDLVFRNQQLEFRPAFEDLKQKYYKEISSFITTPLRFQGFAGGKTDIFKGMPERNSKHLTTVYVKAEELFQKLYDVQKLYVSWTALGQIDLQTYIEQNFKTVEDWESNFQMLKNKRKELKKLPDTQKVDCINVNLVPFKGGIEDIFRRLSDALVETLQTSIEKDSEEVFKFIKVGLEKLNSNPQSVEEIEKMHQDAVQIQVEKEDIVKIFEQCEKKNLMIKQMTGQAMKFGEIESMWREFDARLNAFNDKIEDQKTRLRKEIDMRAKELNADLEKMFERWQEKKPKDRNDLTREEALETSEMMKELRTQWVSLQDRITKIYRDCEHFKKEKPVFTYYDKLKDELQEQEESWRCFDDFNKEMQEFAKEDWITYRKKGYYAFQDFFIQWQEKFKQRNKDVVVRFLLAEIESYKQAWPLIKLCVGESFEKEHWRRLITLLEMPKEVTLDNMKFKHILDSVPVMIKRGKEIKELSDKAQGEVTIREAIRELRVWCDSSEFTLTDYDSNGRRTPLIKEWKEIITQVSDNQSLLISLKESRFFAGFADQIEQFEKKLGGVDDYLSKLNIIQRKWVYLEPIFMRGALPSEQGRFRRVDEEYRNIMLGIGANPKVVSLCEIPGLKDTLETILTQLDMCQKALNDFLEQKRSIFSRFYFIGDDDLLEILGQAKNPAVIQSHLKKLFAGIYKVEFDKNNTQIMSMISQANEYVPLKNAVRITDDVEVWLGELERSMRDTLNMLLHKTLKTNGLDIVNTPSQICCLSEMINFSENCTKAIKSGKLSNYKQDLLKQLESYTSFDNKGDVLLFSKVKALILDIIHNVDVVEQLTKDNIVNTQNTNDWMWFKQLKYFIDVKNEICKVGMCDAFFDYTYEYQGNAPKLVHTPLTDKCYLTLVLGMKMGYGGNPYGPAGTGKTESVKALGQAFGRQVLVFNCDEGLDYKAMGRIFIGLVKCGAWGCFDEFNRLLEEQLSAISQQIQVIQWAIKEGQPSLELLGRRIEVNKNAGIFVTMNPAGKGYGGRSKLPDNLKQLFRPVAMSVPDNELIAETLLYSEGFKNAKKLANKIVSLFKLCRQLLSEQQHYDWGLRALKTILTTGGQICQNELKKGSKLTYEQEALLLIKAIRINTMSKLTYADSKKYEALQSDMFPGIQSEDIAYEQLTASIKEALEEMKLEYIDSQIQKILQFYEATRQRMGVVIVGPSGCGKTTIWKILKLAYEKMKQNIVTHIMNPKSMPRNQLLGLMNHDTREFNDGVLTASARAVVKEPPETICWIVCDGDIDPEWVESLNSVLDDNHLLTLPNGERINFGNNINFIFETNDLKFASPATVSRLGMIFLSEEDVDIQRITKTWLKRQDEKFQIKLQTWMEDIFYKALDWTLQRQELFIVETTKIGIVKNALSYMNNVQSKGQFTDAVIKGLGGNFHLQVRQEFAQEVLNLSGERPADPRNLLLNYFDDKTQTWMGFFQDTKADVKIDDLKNPEAPPIVGTVNVQRDIAMIKPWLDQGDSFILVGPEGCGKNLIIRNLIKNMKSTQMAIIHCNSQTSAFHVIQKLNQMCSQSTTSQGRVYRPKDSQRLIVYLKDINLPKPDKYDTIQLIAFLQQIVCYKGFYDDNLEFVYLERVQIVASMNPSTTIGRHKISTRFTANVRIAYMEYPTSDELMPVYAEFMKTILSHPSFGGGQLANSSKKLSQFMIELYSNVKSNFSIDEHRHYLFTPRDITQWMFSLLRYDIRDAQTLIEVLVYESSRIFKDRLVDKQSKAKFDTLMYNLLKQHLKYNDKLTDTYFISKVAQGGERLIPNLPPLGRINKSDFVQMIEQSLRAYEREFKEMNIHLFDDILDLIAFSERALSKPGGCILMAGRSGVGRKTTTQLIAHMLNMNFFSPNISRDYSMKEFKRDLKVVLQQAGVEAQKVCLLIEDHQIIKSEFLEYLNSLISAGEVPGLYTPEELEPLLSQLQEEMRNQYECRTLFELFVSRIQKNLSIVISMDHSHPRFLQYCSSNPALYTKCTILWSEGWTKESMNHVSRNELVDVMNQIQKGKDEIVQTALSIHYSCQHLGASPLKFLNFIQIFRLIFNKIISSSGGQSKHLMAGLMKLEDAAKTVDELSKKAHNSKILLKQKQEEASQAMMQITKSLEEKAARKQEIETLQSRCAEDEEVIQKRKLLVEDELSGIQPEVDAAKELVGKLNSANLNEIKAYKMPPDAVSDVLQGVLRLMGQDDTSWNAMKKFLGMGGVVQNILNFDARQVTKEMRNKVNKLINEKPMSFEQSYINSVSKACAPLAAWVRANVKYSEVLLKIEPLTSELYGLQQKLQKSQQRVAQCQKQLDELDGSVQILNNNFAQKTQEAESLKFDLKRAEDTLHAAQSLLGQLSGENERWRKQIQVLEQELSLVPIKSLLSSAYITYLGGANESVREKMLNEWLQQARLQEFNFRTFLSTESQLLTWKKEGLPADILSQENAIMILNSNRTPLIIDPATQATEWLKKSLKQNSEGLEILNHQDPKFNTTLELSIRFGKVLIILEVDGIESMLFPVLRRDLIQQGPRQIVQIGDKPVDYNPNFKLFLCTRDQFVDIPPNASALITAVNFTVTKSGLEGQLLSITINFEQPELESRKTQLLEQEEQLKIQLASYEKMLLDELANSEGNILENKSLIESLNQTKKQSTQIESALQESHQLQISLDSQRNVYKAFAHIGSNLFMVIGDLIKINNMYQFSLQSFIKLFKRALETKPQASSIEEKLSYLSNSLIRLIYSEIGRSLFKADRLTYSLHFVKGVFPNLFGKNEWEFFSGTVVASADSHMQLPRWASKDRKEIFSMFANTFSHLIPNLQLEIDQNWSQFMKTNSPEKEFPPHIQMNKITAFQKCILIQVFRPDRLESAMNNFVKEAFGGQTVQVNTFALKSLYELESTPNEPILFIISPGSDPSAELQEFAEQVVGKSGFHEIAMGGGQNDIAIETIKQAAQKGEWVCLKNLHLVTPWLPVLEKEFKLLNPQQKFRLWLTSEPHPKFPSILLQSSLKITYETPPGVRNNMQRTFQYVAPAQGSSDNVKTQLLFVLSWFHALIQERRTYIPQGWTKYYEFSYGDLKAGEAIIANLRNDKNSQGIQWQKVYGILENAIYGGRIDNDFDLRVLKTYMQQIFTDNSLSGSRKLSDILSVPQSGAIKDFVSIINQVPEVDNPNMFGLPSNIDRSVQRFNSMQVISQLKSLSAVGAEELRFDKDKWQQLLGPICQLWNTLYRQDEYHQIRISQQQLSSQDPIEAFVYMEMLAVIEILANVHETIVSISKVLQGTEMLTPDTEKVAQDLLKGNVPLMWSILWEGPPTTNAWIRMVNKKAQSLRQWVQKVQQQSLLKGPVNLSDLFHPETFLNALRQRAARQLKFAIDELKLVSSFEQGRVNLSTGVQLDGLFLQGCDFDGTRLTDIKENSGTTSELILLPPCNIAWIKKDDPEPYGQGAVNVPVYHSIDREKLLCTFNVPNNGEDWKRIIGGVALFLNGSEA